MLAGVFYAASCYLFFYFGYIKGRKDGVESGVSTTLAHLENEMIKYPTKYKRLIDRLSDDET